MTPSLPWNLRSAGQLAPCLALPSRVRRPRCAYRLSMSYTKTCMGMAYRQRAGRRLRWPASSQYHGRSRGRRYRTTPMEDNCLPALHDHHPHRHRCRIQRLVIGRGLWWHVFALNLISPAADEHVFGRSRAPYRPRGVLACLWYSCLGPAIAIEQLRSTSAAACARYRFCKFGCPDCVYARLWSSGSCFLGLQVAKTSSSVDVAGLSSLLTSIALPASGIGVATNGYLQLSLRSMYMPRATVVPVGSNCVIAGCGPSDWCVYGSVSTCPHYAHGNKFTGILFRLHSTAVPAVGLSAAG
ncbi:hypothetical protein DENSPDRAFT_613299 [Dentipellis sp. KUC8613]|nr:hypothetical protein DENSPDRAFT_613299 [Dentipellis sp. KUC8613]